ncbi:hypothetical protein CcI49_02765 [Frankia sp. CcI49]|uniref:hypothetical protein n=1 Tax=Frankia sp. CcI49 TaxID=1745382 RepID=UPI0009781EC7|nr:hypothetical protein [Frankia sp. CcI49]ONH62317.1 hypothetical protein CcI49_02765 [Frankia sp. CcI49]
MTTSSPDQFDLATVWRSLSGGADYADDVTDEGDGTVAVNACGWAEEVLRAAIATGKPVRVWARDRTRLTAEDIAEAERTAQAAGWLTELPLDRPWGWVVPPELAGEYL